MPFQQNEVINVEVTHHPNIQSSVESPVEGSIMQDPLTLSEVERWRIPAFYLFLGNHPIRRSSVEHLGAFLSGVGPENIISNIYMYTTYMKII